MLSIEEIKLLIDKLEKIKEEDLQKLIDSNLKILKDLELAVDANNADEINRIDKTLDWFREDLKRKREKPIVDPMLFATIKSKINALRFKLSSFHFKIVIQDIPLSICWIIWI